MRRERAGVQVDDFLHKSIELSIPRMFRRQPHMNSPGLEFVALKDATNRFGRNAVYDFITD